MSKQNRSRNCGILRLLFYLVPWWYRSWCCWQLEELNPQTIDIDCIESQFPIVGVIWELNAINCTVDVAVTNVIIIYGFISLIELYLDARRGWKGKIKREITDKMRQIYMNLSIDSGSRIWWWMKWGAFRCTWLAATAHIHVSWKSVINRPALTLWSYHAPHKAQFDTLAALQLELSGWMAGRQVSQWIVAWMGEESRWPLFSSTLHFS